MSSNYQQKKMMNALGAIDTKGNIVLAASDGSRRICRIQPSYFKAKPRFVFVMVLHDIVKITPGVKSSF